MHRFVAVTDRLAIAASGLGALAVCALATGAFPLAASAQDSLSVDDAVALAREANPGLRVAHLRADAAGERIAPAGAFPDPMLSLGLMNRPFTAPGTTDEPMTMNSVQVTQRFPWPGKLRFGSDRARYLAHAMALDADELELQLEARVREVYYQVAYIDRALDIMRETRDLLRNFRDVSNALFGVGTGLQQDVLQAHVAVAGMTEDITAAEQTRVALVARLNALLGRSPDVLIGRATLPPTGGDLPSLDELMQRAVDARPALLAAAERIQAATAGYRAAGRAAYPDITVTLGYANRPQYVDFSTLMVGITLPVFAGSRYAPLQREMDVLREAAESGAVDVYNETYALLAESRADATRARNLSTLYGAEILPQARASVESALSAYRVGQVDYMTLLNNEMTVNRYEIESVRLHADYLRAVARIEALVGSGFGGVR